MFCSYRQACESEFQTNTAIFKITNARNMSTHIETQNQFGIHHHLLTSNMQMCIGRNYHVLITTRFIFTNPIKYDMFSFDEALGYHFRANGTLGSPF